MKYLIKWRFDDSVGFTDVVEAETAEQAGAEARKMGAEVCVLGGGTEADVTVDSVHALSEEEAQLWEAELRRTHERQKHLGEALIRAAE